MEVPTKWSRASVISFIKGLGKHAGVCAPMGMFASLDLSGFTQTGHCQGTRYVQELVFLSHLLSEVRSHGRRRSGGPTDSLTCMWTAAVEGFEFQRNLLLFLLSSTEALLLLVLLLLLLLLLLLKSITRNYKHSLCRFYGFVTEILRDWLFATVVCCVNILIKSWLWCDNRKCWHRNRRSWTYRLHVDTVGQCYVRTAVAEKTQCLQVFPDSPEDIQFFISNSTSTTIHSIHWSNFPS